MKHFLSNFFALFQIRKRPPRRMTVFRALSANLFTLYQSVLAFIAITVVLHILQNLSWLQSLGYSAIIVGGYGLGQGMVNLVNLAVGYRKNSPTDSAD